LTRIYLIRHAEAEGNIYRRAHGQANGQIIGRALVQIEQLKERFITEEISAVYSSDLQRAVKTADAICEPRGMKPVTDPRLREVMMGVWEDIAWGNLEYYEPEMNRVFSSDPALWRIDGGEEYTLIQKRMTGCISEIGKRHDGESVAVFSHGYAIRTFICAVMGIVSSEIVKVPYCDNTAVALLTYDNGRLSVVYQGDNSHLRSDTSTFANQTWWRAEGEIVRENLRFEPLNEDRDAGLLKLCNIAASENCGSGIYTGAGEAKCTAGKEGVTEKKNIEEREGIIGKEYRGYTAFLTNKPVGLLGMDNKAGWIRYIFVKPEMRKRNFGVQLLGQAVSESRRQRREILRVGVHYGDPSIGFFKKFDFKLEGGDKTFCILAKNVRNW